MNKIRAKIRNILEQMDILSKPIDKIKDGEYLLDLGLRSINIVQFIKKLEEIMGFEFLDDDMILSNFKSINEIERLVKRYMQ